DQLLRDKQWLSWQRGEMMIREDPGYAQPVVAINAARQLDVWPGTLRGHLTVKEGAEVKAGSILAAVPSRLGLQVVYSPVDGRVEKIDDRTGVVYLLRPVEAGRKVASFYGRVAEAAEDRVVLQVRGARLWGVFGEGSFTRGPLRWGESPGPHLEGSLWIFPGPLTPDLYRQARVHGARGVITGAVGQPLGGDLPYLVTEGFGDFGMLQELADFLRQQEGVEGFLSPRTQVQAGGLRPHLTLSGPGAMTTGTALWGDRAAGREGETVILRRGPRAGERGHVRRVLPAVAFASHLTLPAAEIELGHGERVTAALDNLEVLRSYETGD
ncbi:MAG: hypothetical protein QJR00_04880, partial [Bacillota bacterium]|nr:hypothetical protein [Bacillota bacterium]